ncbi:unnamed protein product, partial [Chrysoparadoxa australica]
ALGHKNQYLSNVLHDLQNGFATELMQEPPIAVGITSQGFLSIGSTLSKKNLNASQLDDFLLKVTAVYEHDNLHLTLKVLNSEGKVQEELKATIKRENMVGNIALACHGLNPPPNKNRVQDEVDHPRFWFSDWVVSGDKFSVNPDQTLGPVLWSQYTLNRGTLKLMTFFVPMDETENNRAQLQIRLGSNWQTIATSQIDRVSRSVLFR